MSKSLTGPTGTALIMVQTGGKSNAIPALGVHVFDCLQERRRFPRLRTTDGYEEQEGDQWPAAHPHVLSISP